MYKNHRIFFSLGLAGIFALFFLFLAYYHEYKLFVPKPPVISMTIPLAGQPAIPNTFLYDFENVSGLENLTTERSFSSQYALKVKGKRNATPPVQIQLDTVMAQSGEAHYGAWICKAGTAEILKGLLVFQIVDQSNKVKYSALSPVEEKDGSQASWFYVCGKADWKESNVQPGDLAKVYFWNNTSNTVYIDDVLAIFGKQSIKGEKNLSEKSFNKKPGITSVNQPPYPVFIFEKEFVGNVKNTTVFLTDGIDSLKFFPDDEYVPGKFIKSGNSIDQLMIIRNTKPYGLVWYDPLNYGFSFLRFSGEADKRLSSGFPFSAADIDGNGIDEIITCTPSQVINIFKYNSPTHSLNLVFSGTPGNLPQDVFFDKMTVLNKKNTKEKNLLLSDKKGNIVLVSYRNRNLKAFQLGAFKEIISENPYQILCGKFRADTKNENLLLFYSEKKTGRCFYKLFEVDQDKMCLNLVSDGGFENKCDTLYPDNSFFKCDINNDKIDELLSFSKGWRYDGKWVSFDKSGYVIGANIDFAGYPKDHNPKYFEKLSLVAGNFIEKNTTSVFTLCGSLKNGNSHSMDLSPYVGIFSYKNKE
ncbi:MAG TPA: hypothetical protein PKN41_08580 [Bacteroidales bacterium]|nr:hypothetical protein [Bacteroidales bacterium]